MSLWNKTCLNSDCQPYHRYEPLTLNNIEHKKSTTYGVKNLVSGLGHNPINEIPYGWEDLSAPLMLTQTQDTQTQRDE